MAISFVAATHTPALTVPVPVNTATSFGYTVTVPPGTVAPAVLIAIFVAGGQGASTLSAPFGWTRVGGVHRSNIYVYPWTASSPSSFTFTASGASTEVGYWLNATAAYNGAIYDTAQSVLASQFSPPVTTSTPFDWLVSIFTTTHQAAAASPGCSAGGNPVANRLSYLWTTPGSVPNGGIYGIAVADSNGVVPQGLQSSDTYVWSQATSTLADFGTTTIALSGAVNPSTPTNSTPANGAFIDFSTDQFFRANYNNIDGSVCAFWQFRQKISGAATYNYWNAGSAAFQSTAVWNAGTCAFTLPAHVLSNANTYNWSFNTQSSYETTLVSGFASDFTVIGQPGPTVNVAGPSGTVATASPTVTWSAAPGGTSTLTGWRVVTYLSPSTTATGFAAGQSSGLLDDSGTHPGTQTSYTVGFLPNSSAVTSYVQVTQSGNQTSAWQPTTYTTSYVAPNAPTLSTAGAQVDFNGAPVVGLSLDCPTNTVVTGGLSAVVYFTDANNLAPTAVRNTQAVTSGGGTVVIADYEATFGVPRTYQAQIVSTDDGPSAYSNAVTVTQMSGNWVLSDPVNPSLFLVLSRASASSSSSGTSVPTTIEVDRARNQTVFRPFGKATATVQYGDVYAPTFTLSFFLQGYAQATMYDALWASTDTLLVRSTMGDAWYVDAGPTRPLQVLKAGDTNPWYVGTLTCTVTDSP